MPVIVIHSGFSSGTSSQLKMAPATGIINFQRFSSETFTPGRLSRMNQIEKAVAAMKLSQSNTNQYCTGNDQGLTPSTGSEIRYSTRPPPKSEDELSTAGFTPLPLSDTTIFPGILRYLQ